jgi:hypothetical protein
MELQLFCDLLTEREQESGKKVETILKEISLASKAINYKFLIPQFGIPKLLLFIPLSYKLLCTRDLIQTKN